MKSSMVPNDQKLHTDVFDIGKVPYASLRDGLSEGLLELAEKDERVVVLSADVSESVKVAAFKDRYPERYIELGVAEQNMAGVAAGLANYGKIPYIAAYAAFSPGRNWEQIRTLIALSDLPVKIMGMHTGVSVGPDGATHQALEDITLMRVVPNMQIIVPCDKEEARKAVVAASTNGKPTYIRFTRPKVPHFTTTETPFRQSRAEYLWHSDSPQVAIIGVGPILHDALLAARELEREGIGTSVLNVHSIKPMDIEMVLEATRRAGRVVTVEEHQILGGVGGTIAEILAQNTPLPVEMVAVHDQFGQSGTAEELLDNYGLNIEGIMLACKRVLSR